MNSRKLVHFFGLKRSGNHAITNWIIKNVEADNSGVSYFNNVIDPFSNDGKILKRPFKKIKDIIDNQKGGPKQLTIITYEDYSLKNIKTAITIKNQRKIMKKGVISNILLIRDPFNTFASRMKRIENLDKEGLKRPIQNVEWPKVISLWKQYAKEYLGITNYLERKIIVNYNNWTSDKSYRDKKLKEIGHKNMDLGIETVPNQGHGSSFDLLSKDGNASSMKVLERWEEFKNIKKYRDLFRDKEIKTLSEKIFGQIKGTEEIFSSNRKNQ
ncbi:MAG: hypothetical protein AABW73_03155 [Nanoarchaeota archaeon]